MTRLKNLISSYVANESGATAIEYGLIAALIAVGIIVGAKAMGGSINGMFTNVDSDLGQAFEPSTP